MQSRVANQSLSMSTSITSVHMQNSQHAASSMSAMEMGGGAGALCGCSPYIYDRTRPSRIRIPRLACSHSSLVPHTSLTVCIGYCLNSLHSCPFLSQIAMPNEAPATSILELLLHPNPTVSHRLPRTKTNSRRNKWHCPEKVGTWDELSDIRTLHDAFGGRLLEKARRGGRDLPCYPTIHPQADCIIRDEPDTEKMINKWNKEIVNAAVVAISPEFRTAIWCKGDPPLSEDDSELPPKPKPERTQPPRGNLGPRPRKTQSLRGMKSDSGSILLDQSHSDPDFRRTTFSRELFPKEYKPAGKWMSRWIYDYGLIDENGRWARGKRAHNYAWPIKQAYTYCIQHMCRYGCILTCREAFIFRVKPLDKAPGKSFVTARIRCLS